MVVHDPEAGVRQVKGGEQRPQHPPAVHRKCRDHVEQSKKQIHRREAIDERDLGALDAGEIAHVEMRTGDENEAEGDRDIDQRSRDRDQEFLLRLFRNALQPSQPADRQQRHVRRRDAEGARGEDVTKFVRHHAREQQEHEGKPLPGGSRAA